VRAAIGALEVIERLEAALRVRGYDRRALSEGDR
jgi:hypothetical protein